MPRTKVDVAEIPDPEAVDTRPVWAKFIDNAGPAGAQGTVRIAALLRIVAASNTNGMKLNDIVEAAGLEQSTAHRIVTALHSVGFLSREPAGKRYYLGPLLFELFTTAFPHFNMREICRPYIERVAKEVGDTVYVSVRSGFDSVCVDLCEAEQPIRTCTLTVGARRPLGLGASSLVILSCLSPLEAEAVIAHNAPAYAAAGVEMQELLARLEKARGEGYLEQAALTSAMVRGVSMPIIGKTGHSFGALSITTLAGQMTPEKIAQMRQALGVAVDHIRADIAKMGYV